MQQLEMQSVIESILFLSGEEVEAVRLAKVLDVDVHTVGSTIKEINKIYKTNNSGINIAQLEDCYQMCVVPSNSEYIEEFFKEPRRKVLTQPNIETLAIIAYSQPITKVQIEDIRGVRSDHTINKLIEYELICEKGRLDVVGKPILFGTTDEFLRHFKFTSIDDIPKLQEDLVEKFKLEVQEEIDYYE